MVENMKYTLDTSIEDVKKFVGEGKVFPVFDKEYWESPLMWNIKTRFGIQTLHTNTYIVKTNDDIFIMSKESFKQLCWI